MSSPATPLNRRCPRPPGTGLGASCLATRCGDPHRRANDRTRTLFNAAVVERLDVKAGGLRPEQYRPSFDGIVTVSEFESGTRADPNVKASNVLDIAGGG
ncbi:MAG TPA: hypothetical protein VMW47_04225 [Verrucomicrobiae bacterium]|nr:hypothetical protein [Verrucomicrobiae bacterium]